MASIFLSHTAKDKKFVKDFAYRLKQCDVKVWVDEAEIKVGDSLIRKIEEGINEMEFLGVVLSPNSVNSEWVRKEVEIAMTHEIKGKKVKVLPLLLKHCDIPSFLEGKLFADFTMKKNFESSFNKVLEVLRVFEYEDERLRGEYCISLRDFKEKIKQYFSPCKTEIEIFEDTYYDWIDFIKVYRDNSFYSYYGYKSIPSKYEILSKIFKKKIVECYVHKYGADTDMERTMKVNEIKTKYKLSPDSHVSKWKEYGNASEKLAWAEWENWFEGSKMVFFTIED